MKVLLISRDYTTSNIIKNAFNNIGVDLKICLISKGEDIKAIAQKNEDIICMLDNLDIDNICYNIRNVEIKFNYIFTNDELLIDKIKIIANRINSKCVQDHISTSRNKLDFKKLIKKSQIKTSKFEVIYNKNDLNNLDIYLPCVVKPIDGFSSNGV